MVDIGTVHQFALLRVSSNASVFGDMHISILSDLYSTKTVSYQSLILLENKTVSSSHIHIHKLDFAWWNIYNPKVPPYQLVVPCVTYFFIIIAVVCLPSASRCISFFVFKIGHFRIFLACILVIWNYILVISLIFYIS